MRRATTCWVSVQRVYGTHLDDGRDQRSDGGAKVDGKDQSQAQGAKVRRREGKTLSRDDVLEVCDA